MNIKELFGLSDVSNLMIGDRNYSMHKTLSVACSDLIVGVELEIEGWEHGVPRHTGFSFEEDGSLRNNGMEAITKPTKAKYIPKLLEGFFKHFEITPDNYSGRCSTHVHVNCQDLTTDQVQIVCLLYQVLERPLFGFIGHERDGNIFCVPWNQCNLTFDFVKKFTEDPHSTARTWQKYTALNLIPLRDRGTLEFRHLEGTCDVERITAWINIISSMFKYAMNNTYDDFKTSIINMNSISNYGDFIHQVLGEYAVHITSQPTYQEDISVGVVDCKLCMINDANITKKEQKTKTARFDFGRAEAVFNPAPAPTLDDYIAAVRRADAERNLRPPEYYIDPADLPAVEEDIIPTNMLRPVPF